MLPRGAADNADETDHAVPTVDISKPNIARVYDYWLGGKDNFAADREEAERMQGVYPQLPERARENRLFLARAVTWLAEHGIRQFLDVGSGLPTTQNTHQVAQQVDSACRVVYVDNDPMVVSHAAALLASDGVAAIRGDMTDPLSILTDPVALRHIQPHEPIGLILALVLHFVDPDSAQQITAAFANSIAPGSYVVLSVGSGDDEIGEELAREYTAGRLHNHTPVQVSGFFGGLEQVGCGLADARDWEPGLVTPLAAQHQGGRILAGVGRKR